MSASKLVSGPDAWPDVAGIVPAAGASTRMGSPKGLLRHEGRTFTARVVEVLSAGGCGGVWVVIRAGDEAVAREARASGATVIENADPGSGPITSLRRALMVLPERCGHVVWLPLDHPDVGPATVRRLIREARAGDAHVTLPVHGGERGHPAVFARALFTELLDPDLEGGARTVVHRCLESGRARLVETDDPGVLVDVDTRAEYEALVRDLEAGS